ncbi:MAG: hypothetical protein M3163_13925, partial [Actinomycetota bacterium]|nr:hypothetical protein [Actinomycetota bacterium]
MALLGGVAGLSLTADRSRRLRTVGTLAGAALLSGCDTLARRRRRPNEIPALWNRIVTSGAMAAPV